MTISPQLTVALTLALAYIARGEDVPSWNALACETRKVLMAAEDQITLSPAKHALLTHGGGPF
jgi:hypothetical protein